MTDVIMQKPLLFPLFPQKSKKYAVRLRLKKTLQQRQNNQQIQQQGQVASTLKQQNKKLNKNIEKLSHLSKEQESFSISLKKSLQLIQHQYKNKQIYRGRNEIVMSTVKRFREGLKLLYDQIVFATSQLNKQGKQNQCQMFTSGSSGKFAEKSQNHHKSGSQISNTNQLKIDHINQLAYSTSNKNKQEDKGQNNSLSKQKKQNISSSLKIESRESVDEPKQVHNAQNQCQQQNKNTDQAIQIIKSQQNAQEGSDYNTLKLANAELQGQSAQMQSYIIQLKENINEKQKLIKQLEAKNTQLQNELKDIKQELEYKTTKSNIFQQEIIGYEQKIQELEQKLIKLNQNNGDNGGGKNVGQDYIQGFELTQSINHQNANSSNIKQNESQQKQYKKQQLKQLQKIYKKTQQTLQKLKNKQQQVQKKQQQIKTLTTKLQQLTNMVYTICSQQQNAQSVQNLIKQPSNQLVHTIGEILDKKLTSIQQSFNERQNKLSDMIASELNQALKIIMSMSISITQLNQGTYNQHAQQLTIIDKIQYIKQTMQYIFTTINQQNKCKMDNNTYFNTLITIYSNLEDIISKSQQISTEIANNSSILENIIKEIQEKEQTLKLVESNIVNNSRIFQYLAKLEELLLLNDGDLCKQGISQILFPQKFVQPNFNLVDSNANIIGSSDASVDSRNSNMIIDNNKLSQKSNNLNNSNSNSNNNKQDNRQDNSSNKQENIDDSNNKAQEYLAQLQDVLKNLFRMHKSKEQQMLDKRKNQSQRKMQLKNDIKQASYLNENIINKMQQIINKIKKIKSQQDLKSIQLQLTNLNQKLKQENVYGTTTNKQQLIQEKLREQSLRLKQKYFPNNPQFVQIIISKLLQIRRTINQQSILEIADTMFSSIKNRDDKYKHQMGRRKEIMRQRTAAIAQICKKGIKDNSIQEKYINRKQ